MRGSRILCKQKTIKCYRNKMAKSPAICWSRQRKRNLQPWDTIIISTLTKSFELISWELSPISSDNMQAYVLLLISLFVPCREEITNHFAPLVNSVKTYKKLSAIHFSFSYILETMYDSLTWLNQLFLYITSNLSLFKCFLWLDADILS